jgi:hypothetical protein
MALEWLNDVVLGHCPAPQCNSIAWTLWHMNRVLNVAVHIRL